MALPLLFVSTGNRQLIRFIRADGGENVLFLNGAIRESDPSSIRKGTRECLDVLKSQYGLTAINVSATESPEGHE